MRQVLALFQNRLKATCPTISASPPNNAARSGLDQYDADAGFKVAGIDPVLGFGQGPGWRASLIGRYRRLLNEAGGSPIVRDEGERDQYVGGAVVSYRF